jgi:FAD/FMN-containing dehydrogenase
MSAEIRSLDYAMQDRFSGEKAAAVWTRRGFIGALGALAAGSHTVRASGASDQLAPWRDRFPGRSVARGERDYESWRDAMPWQMYTAPRRPELILRPDSAAAVADAVRLSRQQNMSLAIKSGGHNVSEAFLRNGGILLDLGELQGIEIDAEHQTAWVQPALWSHGLLRMLAPHGLAFPVAHCATVPMGGYLLGGGLGYNHDNWGILACHSVLAAEVVLANGETVITSPDSYPELYWALRGAGTGFFGVVTRYKLQLYTAPQSVYESAFIFPFSQLQQATSLLQAWAQSRPADTELMMLLAHNPMAPPDASSAEHKMAIVRAVVYGSSVDAAQQVLGALGKHPLTTQAMAGNELQPTGLEQMSVSSVDARMGLGFGRYAVDTIWTDRLPQVMEAISDHFIGASSAKTHFVVSPKMNRVLPEDAAFSMIGDTFVGAYTMWDEAGDDDANFAWLKGASARMRPLAVGQYINEVDGFRDPSVLQRCFSRQAWPRLATLRRKYDPHGVFAPWPGTG